MNAEGSNLLGPGGLPKPTAEPVQVEVDRWLSSRSEHDMSAEADAFAALEHIVAGDWDRFLLRLRAAIEARRKTDEYQAHLMAGWTSDEHS